MAPTQPVLLAPRRVQVTGPRFHPVVPAGAVWVGRSGPYLKRSPWHNPHNVGHCRTCKRDHSQREAVQLYRHHLRQHPDLVQRARHELAGVDLACRCALTWPCHADELLRLANKTPASTSDAGKEGRS